MAMSDIATFRSSFPEFASTTKYTDSMINFWYDIGVLLLNEERWGDLLTSGLNLYVAHHIALSAQEKYNAETFTQSIPGQTTGITSSKGVDGVSISYDVGSFMEDGAGNWNLTFYGRELIRLARIIGIGGLQLL
jgi:hypothetical protein